MPIHGQKPEMIEANPPYVFGDIFVIHFFTVIVRVSARQNLVPKELKGRKVVLKSLGENCLCLLKKMVIIANR